MSFECIIIIFQNNILIYSKVTTVQMKPNILQLIILDKSPISATARKYLSFLNLIPQNATLLPRRL